MKALTTDPSMLSLLGMEGNRCKICGRELDLVATPGPPDEDGIRHLKQWEVELCNCDLDDMFPRVGQVGNQETPEKPGKKEENMAELSIQDKIQASTGQAILEELQRVATELTKPYPFLHAEVKVQVAQGAPALAPKGEVQTFAPAGTAGTSAPATNGAAKPPKVRKAAASSAGPVTSWVADKAARRVPNFVMAALGPGFETKKAIVEKYGEGVSFKLGPDGKVQMQKAS